MVKLLEKKRLLLRISLSIRRRAFTIDNHEFNKLTDKLSEISQYSLPPVSQGRVLPATQTTASNMTTDLGGILETLQSQEMNSLSIDDLRVLLIDIARNYISSSFYIGDEQLARHTNNGNLMLNRIYG